VSAVVKISRDELWRQRFFEGETFEEIAEADNQTPEKVEAAIRRAQLRREMIGLFHLNEMKLESALENEEFRQRLRRELQHKVVKALAVLLEAKRVIASIDRDTGEITTRTVIDSKIMAFGVEQYRKATSLEEKPAS
jgi:hypothetical protein